jgi:hypothetical protein
VHRLRAGRVLTASGNYDDGRQVLFLGLAKADLVRLAAGGPVTIHGADLAGYGLPPLEIIVAYGRTEGDIADMIRSQGVPLDDMTGRPPP